MAWKWKEWHGNGKEWHGNGKEWHGNGKEWNGMEMGYGMEMGMEWNGMERKTRVVFWHVLYVVLFLICLNSAAQPCFLASLQIAS